MSENALDQLASDFAGVLSAMAESEQVLLDRVRSLRLAQYENQHVNSGPTFSRAAAPYGAPAQYAAQAPSPFPAQQATAAPAPNPGPEPPRPATAPDPRIGAPLGMQAPPDGALRAPAVADWASQTPPPVPQQEVAPPAYEQAPGEPGSGRRDYNYFAELDEKLTGLRQRYLE